MEPDQPLLKIEEWQKKMLREKGGEALLSFAEMVLQHAQPADPDTGWRHHPGVPYPMISLGRIS